MVLDLVLTDNGLGQPYLTSSAITDEECGVEFCQENLTKPQTGPLQVQEMNLLKAHLCHKDTAKGKKCP